MTNKEKIKSPFIYFGGKSKCIDLIWQHVEDPNDPNPNFIEPFAGSACMTINRPTIGKRECINDKSGMIVNFWRSIQQQPTEVAKLCDRPTFECDLHAIHSKLVREKKQLVARLEGDLNYYDPLLAALWVVGVNNWIGGNYCEGVGPWHIVPDDDGYDCLVNTKKSERNGDGIWRQRPQISVNEGINKKIDLGRGKGVEKRIPYLSGNQGINRKRMVMPAKL